MSESLSPTDKIFLRALECSCIVGVIDWEREQKQTVLIDLAFGIDAARAAHSDDIAETIDYKSLAKRIKSYVEETSFQLIETLAERVAEIVLSEFKVPWVEVTIQKPGAIRDSKTVGVTINRACLENSP